MPPSFPNILLALTLFGVITGSCPNAHPLPPPTHATSNTPNSYPLITNYRPPMPTTASSPPPSLHKHSADSSSHQAVPVRQDIAASTLKNSRRQPTQPSTAENPSSPASRPSNRQQNHSVQSPEDKKRLSIFSAIHPALHAAFVADKDSDRRQPPTEPLTKVEYHSTPLRGTEARDRSAIGLANAIQQEHQASEYLNSRDDAKIPSVPAPTVSPELSQMANSLHQSRESPPDPPPTQALISQNQRESYPSGLVANTSPIPIVPYHQEMAGAPQDQSITTRSPRDIYMPPETGTKAPATLSPPPSRRDSATQHQKTSMESIWNRFVTTAKRTLYNFLAPAGSPTPLSELVPPPTRPAMLSSSTEATEQYTKQDVAEIVGDILRQIQLHQDEIRAHKEMLTNTGRWHPDHLTTREQEAGIRPPMLVMRKSMLVPSDVLADAVKTSTRKLILRKPSPMPTEAASRLLTDVRNQLEAIFEPTDSKSWEGTKSATGHLKGPAHVERMAALPTHKPALQIPHSSKLNDRTGELQKIYEDVLSREKAAAHFDWQQRQGEAKSRPLNSGQSTRRSL